MNKKLSICIALVLIIVGCKKITVDFSYSPTEPKAGESVKFTNNSSAGESWMWTFGDNSTSRTKHPSKVYRKPGTYMVTLMVDSAKNKSVSKSITVYDTIPTFITSTDSILLYHEVKLQANIYNPFGQKLTYAWSLPEYAVLQSGDLDDAAIEVYFTKTVNANVKLTINQKDKKYDIARELTIHPVKAPALVMQMEDNAVLRQRIINERLEEPTNASDIDLQAITSACDTVVTFNGITFNASQIDEAITRFANLDIQHLQIDAMAQKWYIVTSDGLFVANFDGSNIMSIDEHATGALYVDAERNRIYWANVEGVYAMPLVKSKNNHFTTTATQYNNLTNVDLITVNNILQ